MTKSKGDSGGRCHREASPGYAELLLHAEPGMSHRFDRSSRSAHFDMCRVLPSEEVEQQLARRSGDAGGQFPSARPNGVGRPHPLKLESRTAQSPCEEPGRTTDVGPKGPVHCQLVRSRTTTVGSADALVVDEELVEVRHQISTVTGRTLVAAVAGTE